MMFRNRRGSYIVEAAILYPIIVVITVMMFMLFIFFYVNTVETYQMAHDCRVESGKISGTVIYPENNNSENRNLEIVKGHMFDGVYCKSDKVFKNNLIFKYRKEIKYSVGHTVVNESEVIWMMNLIGDMFRKV